LLRDAFPANRAGAHNGPVTDGQFTGGQFGGGQVTDPCPQCGSTVAVHSISELASLAQMQLDRAQQGLTPQQGSPQQGAPQQGWDAEPQAGPLPGWAGEPQAGPPPGSFARRSGGFDVGSLGDSIDQAIGDVALGAAARFIGKAVSRRLQRTVSDRIMPALAGQQAVLRAQIQIAEQHPDIRACLNDKVIFLAGGTRVLPMPNIGALTTEQADALVAQLSQG
jgi:hypothetical protein